jgi:uncharacterized delta-60 repeat protein
MSISALSASKFANPMTSGAGSARPGYFKSLSDSEIAALSASEIGDMQTVEMAALSANQIAAFNPQELSSGLETYLSNRQVLPANFIGSLSNAQIGQFSNALLQVTLPQMSSPQINALTQAQVRGLSTTQIVGLGAQKTAALTPAWLNKLSSTQLQGLGTAFAKALSKTQIAGLDTAHVQYLSEAQVASLSKAQLGVLNGNQIAAIDATDIKAMSTIQFGALTKTQLQALTVGQIAQVDELKVHTISAKNLASLSYEQIGAFTIKTVTNLSGDQLASLTREQISRGFNAAKIGALSASRVRAFNGGQFSAMTNAEVAALSLDTMKTLYDRHLNAFTVPQLSSLTEEKIDWLISKKLNIGFTAQQKDAIFTRKAFFADAAPTVANIIADQNVVRGIDFSFAVPLDTFSDADSGDILSYTASLADDASLPSWLQFDAKTLTFSGTPANTGLGVFHLKVTASDPAGQSVSSAFKITVTDNATPTGNVTITGTPKQGEVLTAANTLADADGLGTVSYQWLANGITIRGATDSTLTLTQAQVGKAISVKASYTDGHGIAEGATSAVTRVNAPPTGSVTITGVPKLGQVLIAGNNLADGDRLGTAISYQWMADGHDIAGETINTFTVAQAQLGKAISVRASYTDRYGTAESVTSADTRVNAPPTGRVTIGGTPTQGQELTVSNTLADIDGLDTNNISYQWMANGINITDATDSTLTLTQAHVGKAISVRASYTDALGTAESATSAATALVLNVNDAPNLANAITDKTATQGLAFSFTLPTNTFADVDSGDRLSYTATLANGGALPSWLQFNANTRTLSGTPGSSDPGELNLRITASDIAGAWVSTAFKLTVANVNDAPTGGVAISGSGTPTQNQVLTATNNLADADGMGTISYQWRANGSNIEGATSKTLTLTQAHVGKAISVKASYTDVLGVAEGVTSAATALVLNVNDAPTVANAIANQNAMEGVAFTFAVPTNAFADVDNGDILSYTATRTDGSVLPSWLQFNASTRSFSGIPGSTDPGELNLKVTARDSAGASVSTAFKLTVANVNDAPTGSVSISGSGTPTQNQVLMATNNLADADGMGVISYQWRANGINITDATASTLTLTQAQVGKAISVTANYTDAMGTAESKTSAATALVANVNDPHTGGVTIAGSGTRTQNQVLTAISTLGDADGMGAIRYQWQADGIDIGDATSSSLTLTQAQVGKAIRAIASYTDVLGTAESATSASTSLVANVNDAPTLVNPITDKNATQGVAFSFTVPGNTFADVDTADALTYTATRANGSPLPSWLQFDASTGILSGTPGSADPGELNLKVTARDLAGASASSAFKLTVANVNDTPTVANAVADQNATEGEAFSFTVPSNTFSDVDSGDTLTYTATRADGSAWPSWLQFDDSTGTMSGTPGTWDVGAYNLQVSASDAAGASVSAAFTVTVGASSGTLTKEWTQLLGASAWDQANALAAGADGSIYVSGTTGASPDGIANSVPTDAFIAKFGPDGTKEWTQFLGSSSSDYARAMSTAADGSIYVSGYTNGNLDGEANNGSYDAFITKFNADGSKEWTQLLGTSGNDRAQAITADADSNIYVSGYTSGSLEGEANSGSFDAFITKFNSAGTKQWTRLLGSTGDDRAQALTAAADGSVYVSGYTDGDLDGQLNSGGTDAFIAKFDSAGTKQWTRLLGTGTYDQSNALTAGNDGSVYVSGYTYESTDTGNNDAFIAKFNSDGDKQWSKVLATSGDDAANALITAPDGSVYVSGYTTGSPDEQTNGGLADAFVTKYSA